jgi:hypothetical protein
MKIKSRERMNDYENRIKLQWSPLENVLLSGKQIIPHKKIVEEWNKVFGVPFWKSKSYTYIEQIFHVYLQEKYKDIKNVSFILGDIRTTINKFYIDFTVLDLKSMGFQNDKIIKHTKFEEELGRKLKNTKIKLIVIPIVGRTENGDKGHAVAIILNRYLKTIEYYDSDGSKSYLGKSNSYKYIVDGYFKLKEYFTSMDWFEPEGYEFLDVDYTNPYNGIQHFGDGQHNIQKILPKKLAKVGWCIIYCFIIIHYRIHYYSVDAYLLQKHLLNELTKYKTDGFMSESTMSENVIEFLLNYLVYISEKINDPIFLEKLEKYYPEINPSKLGHFFIKSYSAPYSIRKNYI